MEDQVEHCVQGHVEAATCADAEGSPPPLIVLVRKLHVDLHDREKRDDSRHQQEVEQQETEHCVHVLAPDTFPNVAELSEDGAEYHRSEDGHYDLELHEDWLWWNVSPHRIDLAHFLRLVRSKAHVRTVERQRDVNRQPA